MLAYEDPHRREVPRLENELFWHGNSSIRVTMDVSGHLFPSEAESLAAALDDLHRQTETDKRRTKSKTKAPG